MRPSRVRATTAPCVSRVSAAPALAALFALASTTACADRHAGRNVGATDPSSRASIAAAERLPASADGDITSDPSSDTAPLVLFLGDSLTAGYGLSEGEAFPAVVGELLAVEGHPIRVLNAGVSGDTSAGGLRRLDWLLSQGPDIVVVELGANDGLRGLPLEHTEENLRAILRRARAAGALPLLVGMQVPPNYGPQYAPAFAQLFPRLAQSLELPLVEFLLDGVGGRPELNLADGIHPTAEGHRLLAHNVLPHLRSLVESVAGAEGVTTPRRDEMPNVVMPRTR